MNNIYFLFIEKRLFNLTILSFNNQFKFIRNNLKKWISY